MASKLEQEILTILRSVTNGIKNRDRAVVIGAVLSFAPIFPACLIGAAISAANFVLLRKKKLDRTNERLIVISLIVGIFFSFIWVIMFFWINPLDLLRDVGTQIFAYVKNLFSWILQVQPSDRIQAVTSAKGIT